MSVTAWKCRFGFCMSVGSEVNTRSPRCAADAITVASTAVDPSEGVVKTPGLLFAVRTAPVPTVHPPSASPSEQHLANVGEYFVQACGEAHGVCPIDDAMVVPER